MNRPGWAPEGIDLTRPSSARLYDYFLGGAHNFAVDRELAKQIRALSPGVGEAMRANRSFLRRAVRHIVEAGVRQFLDIGSGIPTVGNVHEVAQQAAPESRVVYVDRDPVAVAHSRAILQGNDQAAVLQLDLREPDRIVAEAQQTGLIDFTEPVALLLITVLHFLPDSDDPGGIVAGLRDRLPSGSYLALSHVTYENQPPEILEALELSKRTPEPLHPRSHAEISGFFGDFVLIEPGLVDLPLWRPDTPDDVGEPPHRSNAFAGVGRKD